jgi:hypothetical protein
MAEKHFFVSFVLFVPSGVERCLLVLKFELVNFELRPSLSRRRRRQCFPRRLVVPLREKNLPFAAATAA